MQVSATLIAAQQAAREARARLAVPQQQQAPQASFAAAMNKTSDAAGGFSALPLKQVGAPVQAAPVQPSSQNAPARLGQHINIVI